MELVILAGGRGLRLKPLTDERPKPLVELVPGKTIMDYQLEWMTKHAKLERIVVCASGFEEMFRERYGERYNGISMEYSIEKSPLGTGGAVQKYLSKRTIDGNMVVMNGDDLTDMPFEYMLEQHMHDNPVVTMLVVPYRSNYGVLYIDKLRRVRKFEEKPAFPDVWINGGVYIMDARKIMKYLPEVGDLERTTLPQLSSDGELGAFPYYGRWSTINTAKDIEEFRKSST